MLRTLQDKKPESYTNITKDMRKGLYELALELVNKDVQKVDKVEVWQKFQVSSVRGEGAISLTRADQVQWTSIESDHAEAQKVVVTGKRMTYPEKALYDTKVNVAAVAERATGALVASANAATISLPQNPEEGQHALDHSLSKQAEKILGEPVSAVVFRDGAYYLIGKNGKEKAIPYQQFIDKKATLPVWVELTDEQKKRLPYADDMAIFLEAYSAEYPGQATNATNAWKLVDAYVVRGGDIQNVTKSVLKELKLQPWVNKVWEDAFSITDQNSRRIRLFELIKNSIGQYDLVVSQIARSRTRDFSNIPNLLAQLDQDEDINLPGIKDAKKASQEMREELANAKKQLQDDWSRNKKTYFEEYKKQFKLNAQLNAQQVKKAEENYMQLWQDQAFRIAYLRALLNQTVNIVWGHQDKDLDIASSILWTGMLNLSSRTVREGGKMLAIEAISLAAGAVTMGTGTMAINALASGLQATRFTRMASWTTHAWNSLLGRAVTEGVAFEIWHGGAKSLIEWQNMYSVRGFGDSILFAGVLWGVWKLLTPKVGVKPNGLQAWVSEGNGLVRFAKWAVIDGVALNIAGVTSKLIFDDQFSYSPEEIAQAFIMAWLFRGAKATANAFKVKKWTDGSLRVEPEPSPASPSHTPSGSPSPLSQHQSYSYRWDEYRAQGLKKWEVSTDWWKNWKNINPKKVPDWVRQKQSEYIDGNKNLADIPRCMEAAKRLWKSELTPDQKKALLEAHNIKVDDLRGKLERLKRDWTFTPEEAKILVQEGYAGRPHGSATWGWQGENSSKETYFYNENTYKSQIRTAINWLKNEGDSFPMWDFVITKEWRTFRIKWPIDEFVVQTQKDLISRLERYLRSDIKAANEFIDSRVKAHVDSLPAWKKLKYGDHTIQKKNTWEVEVVSKDGRVLTWEDLNAFYQEYAEKLLNARMQSFLSKYGDTKFDPKILQEWYGKDRRFYNPVTWAKWAVSMTKWAVSMTWNEIMQPAQTWNAFFGKWGALRTLDNPLIMLNNITKAIVLRDVKMNWFSTDSAMRLAGRWTILTGATIAAGNVTIWPNLLTQLGMAPHVIGYWYVTWSTETSTEEFNKTAFSNYYCWMIWGYIIQQMIGGMSDN